MTWQHKGKDAQETSRTRCALWATNWRRSSAVANGAGVFKAMMIHHEVRKSCYQTSS